jgi:hypothetical protein
MHAAGRDRGQMAAGQVHAASMQRAGAGQVLAMLAMLSPVRSRSVLAMLSPVQSRWPRFARGRRVGSCWQSKPRKRAVLLKKEAFFEFVGYAQANEYAGFKNPPLKPAWIKG